MICSARIFICFCIFTSLSLQARRGTEDLSRFSESYRLSTDSEEMSLVKLGSHTHTDTGFQIYHIASYVPEDFPEDLSKENFVLSDLPIVLSINFEPFRYYPVFGRITPKQMTDKMAKTYKIICRNFPYLDSNEKLRYKNVCTDLDFLKNKTDFLNYLNSIKVPFRRGDSIQFESMSDWVRVRIRRSGQRNAVEKVFENSKINQLLLGFWMLKADIAEMSANLRAE